MQGLRGEAESLNSPHLQTPTGETLFSTTLLRLRLLLRDVNCSELTGVFEFGFARSTGYQYFADSGFVVTLPKLQLSRALR